MKFEILIASKGRPHCPTAKTLRSGGEESFEILVEPQQEADYAAEWPGRTHTIPENNRGLSYVRQYALTKPGGPKWYWMLDDDITGFYEAENGKCTKIPAADCLKKAERLILECEAKLGNLGMAGLEYQQFAWRQKKALIFGGYCDVAVASNREAVGVEFDLDMRMMMDRDFTLGLMSAGYQVVRLGKLAFSAPENGSNKGGLKAEYDTNSEELKHVKIMIKKWGPDVCTHIIKPGGRHDAKINWKALNPTS